MWSKIFSYNLIHLHWLSLLPRVAHCRKKNCVFSGKWNQCTNIWLKMTRQGGKWDSCVFEIVLHTFSQALRATFIWENAALSLYSMCRLTVNLHSHPNIIKSCSRYSHPSRWAYRSGTKQYVYRRQPWPSPRSLWIGAFGTCWGLSFTDRRAALCLCLSCNTVPSKSFK